MSTTTTPPTVEQEPPSSRPVVIAAVAAVVAIVAGFIVAAALSEDTAPPAAVEQERATHPVVQYEVDGTAQSVSITVKTPSGIQQATRRALPLRNSDGGRGIEVPMRSGDYFAIHAQNEGSDGDVRCRVRIDGQLVAENTSRGGFTIASCDGTVP